MANTTTPLTGSFHIIFLANENTDPNRIVSLTARKGPQPIGYNEVMDMEAYVAQVDIIEGYTTLDRETVKNILTIANPQLTDINPLWAQDINDDQVDPARKVAALY